MGGQGAEGDVHKNSDRTILLDDVSWIKKWRTSIHQPRVVNLTNGGIWINALVVTPLASCALSDTHRILFHEGRGATMRHTYNMKGRHHQTHISSVIERSVTTNRLLMRLSVYVCNPRCVCKCTCELVKIEREKERQRKSANTLSVS